jgi:hypothetical protein
MDFAGPITWMSAVRLALGFAGEYSLISLIQDAPEALKIATLLCSIGILIALETRYWLNERGKHLFSTTILALSIIYAGFVVYALMHSYNQSVISARLDELYKKGSYLVEKPFVEHLLSNYAPTWEVQVSGWIGETKAYLEDNVGGISSAKFMNTIGYQTLNYNGIPTEFDNGVNNLVPFLKNLAEIIAQKK